MCDGLRGWSVAVNGDRPEKQAAMGLFHAVDELFCVHIMCIHISWTECGGRHLDPFCMPV